MKKIISVFLALIMVFSVLALTSCKDKGENADGGEGTANEVTAKEKFDKAAVEMCSYFGGGCLTVDAKEYKGFTADLSFNKLMVNSQDVTESVPDISVMGNLNSENGFIGQLKLKNGEDELTAKLEQMGESLYVVFPEASQKFLKIATDELVKGLNGFTDYSDAKLSDDHFKAEESDVKYGDETVKGEKLTLTITKDEIDGFINQITDTAKAEGTEEITVDAEFSDLVVTVLTSDKGVASFEAAITVGDEDAKGDVYIKSDFSKNGDTKTAKASFGVKLDGEDVVTVPVTSTVTEKDGKIDGKLEIKDIKIDTEKLSSIGSDEEPVVAEAAYTQLSAEDGEDGAEVLYDIENEDVLGMAENTFVDEIAQLAAAASQMKIAYEYTGEKTDSKIDIKGAVKVSVSIISVEVPIEYSVQKTDDGCEMSFGINFDYSMAGVAIDVAFAGKLLKEAQLEAGQYDDANAVVVDDLNAEDAPEGLDELLGEVYSYITEHPGLAAISSLFSFHDDDTETAALFGIDNSKYTYHFYDDGTVEISTNYKANVSEDGKSIEVIDDDDTTVLTEIKINEDETKAEIGGIEYEISYTNEDFDGELFYSVYIYDENYTPFISVANYTEDSYAAYTYETFNYEMDDTTISFIAADGTTVTAEYEIKGDTFILDGQTYEYYAYN